MNGGSWIVFGVVLLIVLLAIRSVVKDFKSGKHCGSCPGCSSCGSTTKHSMKHSSCGCASMPAGGEVHQATAQASASGAAKEPCCHCHES